MSEQNGGKRRLHLAAFFSYLLTAAALWAVYCLAIHLLFIWIFWVYVGIFAVSAIAYVILVRGNLSPPAATPPPGVDPTRWATFRTHVLALRRRYAILPRLSAGTLFCLLLDYINLAWLGGMFL